MIVASFILISSFAATEKGHATCLDHRFLPTYANEQTGSNAQFNQVDSRIVEPDPKERHFATLRQLTFGGQNAEAYWSKDGKKITYQTLQPSYPDEQIMEMGFDGSNKTLISTGLGRCTCSYFTPDGKSIYFSSTHEKNEGPQKKLDRSKGYVWMVNPEFSLYKTAVKPLSVNDGKATRVWEPILRLGGYVAETTIDPNGKFFTFTSDYEGDLEIYRADMNGKNIKRLTNEVGYDGGPFVSWDGKKIAYRRDVIDNDVEKRDYQDLLAEHMVRPSKLEIWVMNSDGTDHQQVTKLGGASFAPFIHPDGRRLIFCSNFEDPKGREFDLYMINIDGTNLERITFSGDFDGFPMFTRDGKKLLFASNRYGVEKGETNVFVADWQD